MTLIGLFEDVVAGLLLAYATFAVLRVLTIKERVGRWEWGALFKQLVPAGLACVALLTVQSGVKRYLSTKVGSDVAFLSPSLTTLSMASGTRIDLPEGDQKREQSLLSYANALGRKDRATVLNAVALLTGNQEKYDRAIQLATWAIDAEPHNAQFFNTRGVLHYQKSDYKEALFDFDRARSVLNFANEPTSFQGIVLGNSALAERDLGFPNRAKLNFDASLEVFPAGSSEKLGYMIGFGQLLLETGNAQAARKELEKAQQLAQTLRDTSGEADIHRGLAQVSHFLGDTSDAMAQAKLALQGHRTDVGKAIDLEVLAKVELDLGVPGEALEHVRQALLLAQSAGYQKGIAEQLHLRARIAGRLDEARDDCTKALSIFSSLGYSRGEAEVYYTLGSLQFEAAMQKLKPDESFEELKGVSPDFEASRKFSEEALRLFQTSGFSQGTVLAYGGIGSALAFINPDKPEQAIHSFEQALSLAEAIQYPLGRANQLGNLGLMYKRAGKLEMAETNLQQALNIHRKIGFKLGEARQLMNLADVARLRGKCREARPRVEESISIFRELGAIDLLRRATFLSELVERTCSGQSNSGHHETVPR